MGLFLGKDSGQAGPQPDEPIRLVFQLLGHGAGEAGQAVEIHKPAHQGAQQLPFLGVGEFLPVAA